MQNEQCAEILDRLVDEAGGAHFETAGRLSAVLGGGSGDCAIPRPSGQPPVIGSWNGEQLGIAAIIVDVGVGKGLPRWRWVVALATPVCPHRPADEFAGEQGEPPGRER